MHERLQISFCSSRVDLSTAFSHDSFSHDSSGAGNDEQVHEFYCTILLLLLLPPILYLPLLPSTTATTNSSGSIRVGPGFTGSGRVGQGWVKNFYDLSWVGQ